MVISDEMIVNLEEEVMTVARHIDSFSGIQQKQQDNQELRDFYGTLYVNLESLKRKATVLQMILHSKYNFSTEVE